MFRALNLPDCSHLCLHAHKEGKYFTVAQLDKKSLGAHWSITAGWVNRRGWENVLLDIAVLLAPVGVLHLDLWKTPKMLYCCCAHSMALGLMVRDGQGCQQRCSQENMHKQDSQIPGNPTELCSYSMWELHAGPVALGVSSNSKPRSTTGAQGILETSPFSTILDAVSNPGPFPSIALPGPS